MTHKTFGQSDDATEGKEEFNLRNTDYVRRENETNDGLVLSFHHGNMPHQFDALLTV